MILSIITTDGRGIVLWLASHEGCGPATGLCGLSEDLIRVLVGMTLLKVGAVLVGANPLEFAVFAQIGIVLLSVMAIEALLLCVTSTTIFTYELGFSSFTQVNRSSRQVQRHYHTLLFCFLAGDKVFREWYPTLLADPMIRLRRRIGRWGVCLNVHVSGPKKSTPQPGR